MLAITLMCAAGPAGANGRPAATVSTALGPSPSQKAAVGATFGLLLSNDASSDWRWVCESSIYVGGPPGQDDPRYRITPAGTILAGLSTGLSISRDGGCSWRMVGTPLAGAWIKDLAVSPADSNTLYAVTATTAAQNGLFISRDDGVTWNAVTPLDSVAFYYRVVPIGADAWLSGYDELPPAGHIHLWKYTDATHSVTEVPPTGLGGVAPPPLLVFGAAQGLLYVQGKQSGNDTIFKSTDGGATFAPVFSTATIRAAVLDEAGTLWLATDGGIKSSTDGGAHWTTGATNRMYTCLGKRGATLYGCALNTSGFAFGESSDGLAWAEVMKFQNIAGVLSCAPGTLTHDMCESMWPGLQMQLGIGDVDAAVGGDASMSDGAAGSGGHAGAGGAGGAGGNPAAGTPDSGCTCSVGGSFALGAGLMLALAVLGAVLGRQRF